MNVYPADLIADFFLSRANPEVGDLLSNLKLQKLCYYGAGVMSAVRGDPARPLFEERIEAWQHGPVVPALYGRFKIYGSGPIPYPEGFDEEAIAAKDRIVLDNVYDFYGQYSAWKLRNMTHDEAPWIEAFARDNKVITNDELSEFFSNEVSSEYITSYHETES